MILILLLLLLIGLKSSFFLISITSLEYFLMLSLILVILSIINFNKKVISIILLYLSWFSIVVCYGYISLYNNPMFYEFHPNQKEEVFLNGKVISSVDFKYGKMQCFLKLKNIVVDGKTHKIKDKILLNCSASILGPRNLPYGSKISFSAELANLNNKNKFDTFLLRKNIVAKANVKMINSIESPSKIDYYVAKTKSFIRRTFYKNDKLDFLSENIIFGLLFGEKRALPSKLKQIFINANVYHIFAVSGLHFGVIAIFVFTLLRFFGVTKPLANILTIPILFLFLVIINFPPSSVRAFIMLFFYLIAPLIGRQIKPLHILFVTAIIILLFCPRWHNDVGFILSFTAMFSLLSLGSELDKYFCSRFDILVNRYQMDETVIKKIKIFKILTLAVSYTASAWFGTAPLVIFYFKIFTPISIITNLIAIMFIPIIIKLILLTLIFGFLGTIFVKAFSSVIAVLIHFFVYILIVLEKLPFSHISPVTINTKYLFLCYSIFLLSYIFLKFKNKYSIS